MGEEKSVEALPGSSSLALQRVQEPWQKNPKALDGPQGSRAELEELENASGPLGKGFQRPKDPQASIGSDHLSKVEWQIKIQLVEDCPDADHGDAFFGGNLQDRARLHVGRVGAQRLSQLLLFD